MRESAIAQGKGPALGSMAGTWWPSLVGEPRVGSSEWSVNAGPEPHPLHHVDKVVRGDVARRLGRERAAADPAGAGVQGDDPVEDGRVGVREPGVAGAVEVVAQRRLLADHGADPGRQLLHPGRGAHADRVGQAELAEPGRAPWRARSTTLSGSTSPRTGSRRRWPGQGGEQAPGAGLAATSSATAMASSVLAFWLRRLKLSLTHTTTLTSSTPASTAWSSPRRSRPAWHRTPRRRGDLSHDRLGVGDGRDQPWVGERHRLDLAGRRPSPAG